jgi:hypothetical protein
VALEEEEEQARLANETLLQEMFDLGIYDDNDDSPANDLDSVAGDSRAGSRFTSAARSRSGTYRPMTSTLLSTIPASPASSRSASPSPRSLSPAAHSPRRNPRRTSVFELRRLPKQVAGPAKVRACLISLQCRTSELNFVGNNRFTSTAAKGVRQAYRGLSLFNLIVCVYL